MVRFLPCVVLSAICLSVPLSGGEVYFTGFENFTSGFNKIAGTDGWTGSTAHTNLNLSGIDDEATHGVAGIGNAAFIGGNPTVLAPTVGTSVKVWRSMNVDPVALGQEVFQFRVIMGIKDSTASATQTRRDNFEFAIYNQSNNLIGFIQFDNSTLDTTTMEPAQKIWRSTYTSSLSKVSTGAVFYYDTLMALVVRINFRTNRWTATLDGVAIFSDEVFYSGPQTKNVGVVGAQMQIANLGFNNATGTMGPAPGDNYMLFDDFAVRTDPLPDFTYGVTSFSRDPATGAAQISWLTEALYSYQVQYSEDLMLWKSDLAGSSITAAATGDSPVFTDTGAAAKMRRFYRIMRTAP